MERLNRYFTKISQSNPNYIKIILNTDLTHHSYSIVTRVCSLVRFRVRRSAPSYLTRHGRGFYPRTQVQFPRFLWDDSAPLADDKNLK